MLDLRRLKPNAITIAALIGFIWAASHGAVRDFVWADLKTGMMDTRELSRVTRALARAGFLLLAVMVVALIGNDFWRAQSELIVMGSASTIRGQMVPVALLPLTLFTLATAWSFGLAGALHSQRGLRVLVLALYLLTAFGWASSHLYGARAGDFQTWMMAGAIAAVPIIFLARWRGQAWPEVEFPLIFVSVAALFWLAQRLELQNQAMYGVPVGLAKLNLNIVYLTGLITPLLLLIGLDIAGFTMEASHWTEQMLETRAHRLVLPLALVALFGYRIFVTVQDALAYAGNPTAHGVLAAYGGALVEVLAAAGLFLAVRRFTPDQAEIEREEVGETVKRAAFPLILIWSLPMLLVFVLGALGIAVPLHGWGLQVQQAIFPIADFVNAYGIKWWFFAISFGALGAACVEARKGRHALALYLAFFGALGLWHFVSRRDGLLGFLYWRGEEPLEFWWLALFTVASLVWVVRRRFNREHAARFFFILMALTLMRQRNFIENPFSPFFGFAGIVFIAFALVWDITTRGSWANESTPGLPRIGRIFLYIGYVLLAATVLNWAVTTHDLNTVQKLTGGTSLMGFDRFGKPLIYAVFFLTLWPSRAEEH